MKKAFVNNLGKLSWILDKDDGIIPDGFTVHDVPDNATALTYYFNGESVVEYTEEQLVLKQSTPTYPAKWDDLTMSWEDQRTINSMKIEKNTEINYEWDKSNQSGFEYLNKVFSTDPSSRSDIDGINGYIAIYGVFPDNWIGIWKAKDNTFITMSTVEEWKSFYSAMVSKGTANYLKAQTLKTTLKDAETYQDIEDIHW